MTRTWSVIFEGAEPGTADDFELSFTDLRDVLGGYRGLKEIALNILLELTRKHENYHVIGNIKNIIPPEGTSINESNVWVLLSIDNNNLRFGFLLSVTTESQLILGLWPEPYVEVVMDDERLLNGVIAAILERPDNWRRVDVVLPIKK